jgi:hypothetical protein
VNMRSAVRTSGVAAAVVVLMASWVLTGVVGKQSAEAQGSGSSSRTYASNNAWEAVRGSDFEGIPLIASGRVTVPTAGEGMVLLTLTLDFKTSPGDWGLIGAGIRPSGKRPGEAMRPGSFSVTSSTRNSTTLTWVKKHLGPGKTYVIEVDARAHDGSGNQAARIRGRKITFRAVAR